MNASPPLEPVHASTRQTLAPSPPTPSPSPETPTGQTPTWLTLLRCTACGRLDSRQRVVCSGCLSARLQEAPVEGVGRLVTLTTIRRAPTAWRDRAPYRVVVVDLDAGLRVTGRLAPEAPEPLLGDRLTLLHAEGQDLVFIPLPHEPQP